MAPGPAFETPAGKRRIRDLVRDTGLLRELVELAPEPLTRRGRAALPHPGLPRLARGHVAVPRAATPARTRGSARARGRSRCSPPEEPRPRCARCVTGEVDNAYALVRPPGHHAESHWGRGYCLLANLALAVMKARDELGVGRVAVVDWDVHHGNGTERAFAEDPETLAISLHQDRLYPRESGWVEHVGEGAGVGATVNVPLPSGSGWGAYLDAFDRVVEPAVRRFRPDLVVVASGFDAGGLDPLGRMMLSAGAFAAMTRRVRGLAEELCEGRLAMTHEGGYSELHAPFCGLRVLEEMSGASAEVDDPFDFIDDYGAQALTSHQREAVDAVVARHGL